MPVPPEEIVRKRFLVTMRGYDRGEVDAYMRTIAGEQTRLLNRIRDLEQELAGAARPVRVEADDELADLLGGAARRLSRRRRFRPSASATGDREGQAGSSEVTTAVGTPD